MKVAMWVAALALFQQVYAADKDKEVVETDWAGVRQRLVGREGKTFRIVLLDGQELRGTLLSADDDGLLVRVGRVGSRMKRPVIAAIQQTGRHGRGRLIGTLAGVALMAVGIAHPAKRVDGVRDDRMTRGQAAAVGSILVGMGYIVGFGVDKRHPELRPAP